MQKKTHFINQLKIHFRCTLLKKYLFYYQQVIIRIIDVNDNQPIFTQPIYQVTIAENVAVQPPAAILQVKYTSQNFDKCITFICPYIHIFICIYI